ncbi:hypothetical protein [Conexibacter sp. DBS9H8]|uniref:hypothetical protein n=1 Tax=Conexibacter sp. DBS9H8 TaxID=2937801 RepID=UPI00200E5687|nr:hypothetical protein [Conexibacter sp. DBS9H8]
MEEASADRDGEPDLGRPDRGAEARTALDDLDERLGEIGRREHRFAWLRDPGSGEWATIPAYYPSHRLIALADDTDPALLALADSLAPAHGLTLLRIGATAPVAVPTPGASPAGARPPVPGPGGAGAEGPSGPLSPARGALTPRDRDGGLRAPPTGRDGVAAGVTLVFVVVAELLVGGVAIGLNAGDPVLGLGCLFDAAARVLGTVRASQAGDLDAAWASVVAGSPAIWGAHTVGDGELGTLARATAATAGTVLCLGLVLAVL